MANYRSGAFVEKALSDASSGVNFSTYKRGQVNKMTNRNLHCLQNEISKLSTSYGATLIPDKHGMEHATQSEIADLDQFTSNKMVLRREVGGRFVAPITLTVFGMGRQATHSSINEDLNPSANSTIPIQMPLNAVGAARLHPEYVAGNPFLSCPKTTNQDAYKYKMYDRGEQRGLMHVNK